MKIIRLALLACLIWLPASLHPGPDAWGNLKKACFYAQQNNDRLVLKYLGRLNGDSLSRQDRLAFVQELERLGRRYESRRQFQMAEACFRESQKVSPSRWEVYNALAKVRRARGESFFEPSALWDQFRLLLADFRSRLLLTHVAVKVVFFTLLILFFVFALLVFFRYFKLAMYDFILTGDQQFSVQKVIRKVLLLLWPLIFFGGWAIYPFLIIGFLWSYMGYAERRIVRWLASVLVVGALAYSFNLVMEKSVSSDEFRRVQEVVAGRLFSESDYRQFDAPLLVAQAYAYYDQGKPEQALDVLQAVESDYQSALKLSLLGSLYLEAGDLTQSIHNLRESLIMNEKDKATMSNFTLALLRHGDMNVFEKYAVRFPAIADYRQRVSQPMKIKADERILWQRAFTFGQEKFSFPRFLRALAVQFLCIPIWLCLAIMTVYALLFSRIFPFMGGSISCGKCGKIMRKNQATHGPVLCDECYQLFLIKDPIFFDAKIIKENDIKRRNRLQLVCLFLISLVLPGFVLNFKGKTHVFLLLSGLFIALFTFTVVAASAFHSLFYAMPLFLFGCGVLAFALYFVVQAVTLLGESHGL